MTFDGRGNGKSDRPEGVAAYLEHEFTADALAVMDATGTGKAVLAGLSCAANWMTPLAADHPERVLAAIFIGPAVPLAPGHPERAITSRFEEELDDEDEPGPGTTATTGSATTSISSSSSSRRCSRSRTPPSRSRTASAGRSRPTPATLADTTSAMGLCGREEFKTIAARVTCPVLVIHGDQDLIRPHAQGAALAELTGGELVTLEGSGHGPQARDPVKVNLLLRDFIGRPRARVWTRGRGRRKRALFVSSPIGLGHARRDVAIAQELRALHPDLEIDWLAQHPVTRVLEAEGERVHPASRLLANESAHIESESAEHDLHCFHAWRRMDEILVANFMVFHDLVTEQPYDLWIGDEAWELDYYLHENPELKRAAYVWLTDFVGWLPVADETALTADYNAEMIEHIDRFPRVRDRALFVGNPDDVVDERFGPDLPAIRAWTEQHFDFPGYVTGFTPCGDRERLRAELGYRPGEQVCIVTVGGSGVGAALLRRVIDAFPAARERVPGLRMIVVAGPRIDPASLPAPERSRGSVLDRTGGAARAAAVIAELL